LAALLVALGAALGVRAAEDEVIRFLSGPGETPVVGAISVIDGRHVWVGLTYTEDGGASWVARTPPPAAGRRFDESTPPYGWGTLFVTAERGWLRGIDSTWMTHDAGVTWRRQVPALMGLITFVGRDGWAVAGGGLSARSFRNYRTDNLGESWNQCGDPWNRSKVAPWSSASFLDSKNGWVTVGSFDGRELPSDGGVARTKDGGCTWEVLWRDDDPSDNLGSIRFVDDRTGWLSVGYTRLLATNDGGYHWRALRLPADFGLEDAYLVSRNVGWIKGSGYGPALYYTLDAGAHWRAVSEQDLRWNLGLAHGVPTNWGAAFLLRLGLN
jgi:photosystem II stability/assembly factor-like uncharacterized protein